MVDVDRRISGGMTPAHAAGLRRLSARASSSSYTPLDGLRFSFSPLAEFLVSHLRSSGVPLLPGLTDDEIARTEAVLGLPIPPDLRAFLSVAVPSGPGFPDWRSIHRLRASLRLPFSAASLQICRGSLRPRRLPYACDPRAALRSAPPLLPLFDRCYLPALPCLAGNPVFFVEERRISLHSLDLSDFFTRGRSSPEVGDDGGDLRVVSGPPPLWRRSLDSVSGRRIPRWIEFWSDAATSDRRRRSYADPPDRDSTVKIAPSRLPDWVGDYLDRIGAALRQGGWDDSDITEMVHVSRTSSNGVRDAASTEIQTPASDSRAALESLLLKADRYSHSLRRAGWSSDEVSDALFFDDRPENFPKRDVVKLPPELAAKIGRLAVAVLEK